MPATDFRRPTLSDAEKQASLRIQEDPSSADELLDIVRSLRKWPGQRILQSYNWFFGRRLFLRRLCGAMRDLDRDHKIAHSSDPVANLLALVFTQAKIDKAAYIDFYADECRMRYRIDGTEYDMVPPPLFVLGEVCWLLCKLAPLQTPGETGRIDLGECEIIPTLQVTRLDNEPRRRVRVSFSK